VVWCEGKRWLWDIIGSEDSDTAAAAAAAADDDDDDDALLMDYWLTVMLKKESRAAMVTASSSRLTLSQHSVERLNKSNIPITDDSYKYSYQRTPDGYGKLLFVLCNYYITKILSTVACCYCRSKAF